MSLNVMLGSPATTKHSLPKTFCDIRMEFGEMMLAWFKNWPDLLKNILWSAEAVFHISGFVNVITATTGWEKILALPIKNAESNQDNGMVWNDFG